MPATSYDYSAPISENRVLWDKYYETKLLTQFTRSKQSSFFLFLTPPYLTREMNHTTLTNKKKNYVSQLRVTYHTPTAWATYV